MRVSLVETHIVVVKSDIAICVEVEAKRVEREVRPGVECTVDRVECGFQARPGRGMYGV